MWSAEADVDDFPTSYFGEPASVLMSEEAVSFDDTVVCAEGKLLSGCSGPSIYVIVGPADFGPMGYAISESSNAVMSLTKSRFGTKTG